MKEGKIWRKNQRVEVHSRPKNILGKVTGLVPDREDLYYIGSEDGQVISAPVGLMRKPGSGEFPAFRGGTKGQAISIKKLVCGNCKLRREGQCFIEGVTVGEMRLACSSIHRNFEDKGLVVGGA